MGKDKELTPSEEIVRMKAVMANIVSTLEEATMFNEKAIPSIVQFLMGAGVEPKDLELCKEVNHKVYDAFMEQWNSMEHGEVGENG